MRHLEGLIHFSPLLFTKTFLFYQLLIYLTVTNWTGCCGNFFSRAQILLFAILPLT